jgi:hypothetical protein
MCLQLDTQLIHANLEVVLHALNSFISIETKGHGEVSFASDLVLLINLTSILHLINKQTKKIADVWKTILPKIETLLSKN